MRSSETEVTQLQDALTERSAEAAELQERLDQVGDRRSDKPGLDKLGTDYQLGSQLQC